MLIRLIGRKLVLGIGVLALGASALAGCGFDAATDRPYTPAEGVNEQAGDVAVRNAVVVSSAPGSGTFIASFANGDRADVATMDSLAPAGGSSVEAGEFEAVEIPRGGLVNLATAGGVPVTGEFEAGDFVTLTVGFASGDRATIEVPVVDNAGIWAGLDGEPSASPTDMATPDTTESPSE